MNPGPDSDRIEVSPFKMTPNRLITARSHLSDRVVADCEMITLPGRDVPGGDIPYRCVKRMPTPAGRARLRDRLRGRGPKRRVPLDGMMFMDCDILSPENWSIGTELARCMNMPVTQLTLILPTPS